jgi:uncharacterized protein YndB with AHSA1/START domain
MLMYRARQETVIDAPPEPVYALVSDVARHAELAGSGEVLRIRVLTDGPVRVGTRFQADEAIPLAGQRARFASTSVVVEHDPPRVFSWTVRPATGLRPRRIQWWFRLSPEGAGTRLAHEVEVDAWLLGPLLRRPFAAVRGQALEGGMARTLENLRRLAGAGVAAG